MFSLSGLALQILKDNKLSLCCWWSHKPKFSCSLTTCSKAGIKTTQVAILTLFPLGRLVPPIIVQFGTTEAHGFLSYAKCHFDGSIFENCRPNLNQKNRKNCKLSTDFEQMFVIYGGRLRYKYVNFGTFPLHIGIYRQNNDDCSVP